MSSKILLLVVVCVAVSAAVFIAYARPTSHLLKTQELPSQSTPQNGDDGEAGNLSLQPEAVKLSRRVRGPGFDPKKPRTLVIHGVLATATEQRNVQIRRNQSGRGEQMEVSLAGSQAPLLWDAAAGAHSAAGPLNLNDRALLERFTFDSADEFIFAQLRGAAYSVVARNVRPDDAPEDYSGALWDVIRVDDPEQDEAKKPLSPWRLFYINTRTGLIDSIVCDSQGDRIVANFSDWIDRSGEKFPAKITWTSNGRTLMSFNLTNVSSAAQ